MRTEILSLLSPNAIDLLNVCGGRPSLTPGDVAAALAGLPKAPYYLGMCVYVADQHAFYPLYAQVTALDGIPAKPADLRGTRPVEAILLLCLDELWGDNKCKACGGTGITHEQRQCPTCRGRKYKVYSDLSRSRQANIPWEHWSRYKGFYNRLYTQLTDWDSQIKTHLAKRLNP